MKTIFINFDFTTGAELSYEEGLKQDDTYETNVLDFFSFGKYADDVIVRKKDGSYISRNELLNVHGTYIDKDIRSEHNIHRMLVAGAFKFRDKDNKMHKIGDIVEDKMVRLESDMFKHWTEHKHGFEGISEFAIKWLKDE